VLVLISTFNFLDETLHVVSARQELSKSANTAVWYPRSQDFWITIVSVFLLSWVRLFLVQNVFEPLGDFVLPKDKWPKLERQERVTRWGHVCVKLLYYIIVTYWGLNLLRKTSWLPWVLGGDGDTKNCWVGYPFQEPFEGVKEYYLFQLGYHCHSLLFLFWLKRRGDFLEMTLHHICTIFLVWFSYMINYVRVGTLVFLVHDIGDITIYLARTVGDTNWNVGKGIGWALMTGTWMVTRLVIFPGWIIWTTAYESVRICTDTAHHHGFYFFNFMLCVLFCLHVYWWFMFLKMGFDLVKYGKTEDMVNHIKSETTK